MKEILINLWHMILPPLKNRVGTVFAPLKNISAFGILLLAVYVRIRQPRLAFHWKALLVIICSFIIIHTSFGFYSQFPWQKDGEDEALNWFMILDSFSGGAAINLFILILDYLFLATEEDLNVRGADEYKRHYVSKYGKEETPNKGSLERPMYFPGTKNSYIKELAGSTRGLGFHKGLNQKGIVGYEGGYAALIAVEKLKTSHPTVAQKIKKNTLIKILKTFTLCFLAGDICAWMIKNSLMNGDIMQKPSITTYFVVALSGCSIVARVQASHSFFYLLALLYTKPTEIPITISRWEPLLFAQPHLSTSMQEMWGKHWHAIIRRPITVLCMRPTKQICQRFNIPVKIGRAIGIILSFLCSGLMHEAILETSLAHNAHLKQLSSNEATMRSMGFGWGAKQYTTTRFFVNCGLVIMLEDIWCSCLEPKLNEPLTGKSGDLLITGRARRVIGWLWCMGWMVVLAVGFVEVSVLQFSFDIITDALSRSLLGMEPPWSSPRIQLPYTLSIYSFCSSIWPDVYLNHNYNLCMNPSINSLLTCDVLGVDFLPCVNGVET